MTSPGETSFRTFASGARSGSRARTSKRSSADSGESHERLDAARSRRGDDELRLSLGPDVDLELNAETRRQQHQGLDLGIDLAKLKASDVRLLHSEPLGQGALRKAMLRAVANDL